MTPSEFVRSCPDDWTDKQISEEAEKMGIVVSTRQVYTIRWRSRNTPPPEKRSGGMTSSKITKAQFVRDQPMGMPVDEVISLGKREGFAVTKADVWQTRFQMRQAKGSPQAARTPIGSQKAGVLAYCTKYVEAHGRGPTTPEIIESTGVQSQGAVSSIMRTLRKEGALNWEPGNYTAMNILRGKDAVPPNGGPPRTRGASSSERRSHRRKQGSIAPESLEAFFTFLADFVGTHHRGPSVPEIKKGTGRAGSFITAAIRQLRTMGRIEVGPRNYAGMRIVGPVPRPAAAKSNGAPSRIPALPAHHAPGPPSYLSQLTDDLTRRLGKLSLDGDEKRDEKTAAVKVVLGMLEEPHEQP